MNIGAKIKQLRSKAGLTQDQLASRLGISGQSVSKWETSVTMPDICLLPSLAGELGVSIDELFDLTVEQKMHRIEKKIDCEGEISAKLFLEYEEFLKNQLDDEKHHEKSTELLAYLYHHRMESDSKRVSRYAREALLRSPEKKACQWLLNKAEGQTVWDWNIGNHAHIIDFYKDVIKNDSGTPKTPLPYYYLIDNLIADHRTKEARHYLDEFAKLPAHKPCMIPIYNAHVALAEYREADADAIIETAAKEFSADDAFVFEAAQYYAKKAEYEKAISYYNQSWEISGRPRFTDPMHGIALIYEILGDKKKAAEAYDNIIRTLKDEWGYADDDIAVVEAIAEKARIIEKHLD